MKQKESNNKSKKNV